MRGRQWRRTKTGEVAIIEGGGNETEALLFEVLSRDYGAKKFNTPRKIKLSIYFVFIKLKTVTLH